MAERDLRVLADLIAMQAEAQPDLDVVTFEGGGRFDDEIRSYGDLWDNGNRVAAELIARGMAPGDRFALLMRNHPEFIDVMVGASISACVFVPIDPRSRGRKLAYTLTNSDCRGIICADYCLDQVVEIRAQLPDLEWILVMDSEDGPGRQQVAGIAGAETMACVYDRPATAVNNRLKSPFDPLEIVYTSGTTGDPKGVVFQNARYGNSILCDIVPLEAGDRPYTGLSLTHGNAQMITLATSLSLGLRCVLSRRFTKSRLWDITRKYGCTAFNLLGGMTAAIYAEPERHDDGDNPVRFVMSAGMPATIWEKFERRFNLDVFEFYGAVEGGLAYKPIGVGPVGSFGKAPKGLELKVVDEDGNDCPPGVLGELISRPRKGPAPEVEYFKNQDASAEKTEGGWLRSGDVGHADADGWLFFDYRKGGGIRHNGDFVNPGFVEQVIAEQPDVNDVFVYGIPAASGAPGEKDVVAAVVAAGGAAFDPHSVFAACRRELEANFVPGYLQVVEEIPKTASEKPLERFLLESFAIDAPNVHREERG
ncbi:MAG: AMP-binding protein [Alphaproteobacteria bacterium]|nr:AMP-binding protein [Alphaproteobacteria bacterium]